MSVRASVGQSIRNAMIRKIWFSRLLFKIEIIREDSYNLYAFCYTWFCPSVCFLFSKRQRYFFIKVSWLFFFCIFSLFLWQLNICSITYFVSMSNQVFLCFIFYGCCYFCCLFVVQLLHRQSMSGCLYYVSHVNIYKVI